MRFQIIGDCHFHEYTTNKSDFSDIIIPNAPFLLTTGDIIQPISKMAYNFYSYCAKNWEKTYIMMGNQEYESTNMFLKYTMNELEDLMINLIYHINTEVGSERLVFIQNTFVDFPDESLRIIGLTLWANKSNIINIINKKDGINSRIKRAEIKNNNMFSGVMSVKSDISGVSIADTSYFLPLSVKSWAPFEYRNDLSSNYIGITKDDLKNLQEKDEEFLKQMIVESEKKGYKLLVSSHYIPTYLIKKESPIVPQEHNFPSDFFSRDMSNYIKSPIVAWICGHVHLEQIVTINTIPIYVNCQELTINPNVSIVTNIGIS